MAKKEEEIGTIPPQFKLEVVKEGDKQETPKPTPEQIAQYKLDFDNAMAEFSTTRFPISEPGDFPANETGRFLMNFLKKYAMWSKTGWMGIIKMEEELKNALSMNNEKTGLTLDYQALEFCGYMLMNPGEVGYEAALEFEKQADQYSRTMMTVGEQVENARAVLQSVQYLQEKWAAGEQGFFLAELEPKKEETIESVEQPIKQKK